MVYSAISDDSNTISQFTRRKQIKLTHSGVLTDHQHYNTFDYEPAMLNNFNDIRFTTQSGEHIPYWIEIKIDEISAKVWFMNDYVDGDTHIWMYYGNSGLSAGSSGSDVFIQYHGYTTSQFLDALNVPTGAVIFEAKVKATASTHNLRWGLSNLQDPDTDDSMFIMFYDSDANKYLRVRNEGVYSHKTEEPTFAIDTDYNLKIINTGSAVTGFYNDEQIGTGDITTNLPNENLGLVFQIKTGTAYQDWSFARKYTAVEPTVTVGAEQHQRRTPTFMN